MSELPDSIGSISSILADSDIREAIESGYLLKKEFSNDSSIKYASYELSVGENVLELSVNGEGKPTATKTKIQNNEKIIIWPRQTVRILTKEVLSVPNNILGRVTVLGQIFGSGLSASNTFADPGFHGPLYITLSNVSPRVIELSVGHPIARIEFYKLGKPVNKPHNTGPREDIFLLGKNESEYIDYKNITIEDLKDHIVNCRPGTPCLKHLSIVERNYIDIKTLKLQNSWQKIFSILVISILTFYMFQNIYNLFPETIKDNISETLSSSLVSGLVIIVAFFNSKMRNSFKEIIDNIKEK